MLETPQEGWGDEIKPDRSPLLLRPDPATAWNGLQRFPVLLF